MNPEDTASPPVAPPQQAAFGSGRAIASASGGLMYLLGLIGLCLTVPSGFGLNDFLGWGPGSTADAMKALWDGAGLRWLAQLDLALDTTAFVPCYAATLTLLIEALGRALLNDSQGRAREDHLRSWLLVPLVALVGVDLCENGLGLARLWSGSQAWVLLAALAAGLLICRLTGALTTLRRQWRWRTWPFVAAIALGLGACVVSGSRETAFCATGKALPFFDLDGLACVAHHGKTFLLNLVLGVLTLLFMLWIFGMLTRSNPLARDQRATLRETIGDVLVRSRYVLIALVLQGLLTLALSQARDVVYAALTWNESGVLAPLLVLGAGMAAAWGMAFSCWLWTRSVCEMKPPGMEDSRQQATLCDTFVRDWARVLGAAPLLLAAVLLLRVCGDAILGAYGSPDAGHAALWRALAAGLLGIGYGGLALFFVWKRTRQIPPDKGIYYNAGPHPSWLPATGPTKPEVAAKYKLAGALSPQSLMRWSLLGFFVARAIDLTAAAPPLAQAEIMLAMAFWLCLFGWLSLLETRTAVPWVLLIVAAVGVAGLSGINSHHQVWSLLQDPDAVTGAGWPMWAAALGLGLLLLGLYESLMWRLRQPPEHPWPAWRWPAAIVIALLGALGLLRASDGWLIQDRWLQQPLRLWPQSQDPRPGLDAAMVEWLTHLDAQEPKDAVKIPVYLIATAGGGIRATAWTAELLQQWQREDKRFAARTFAISGASGGSVGAAVFKACLQGDQMKAGCVDEFLKSDLISPLLSAWMFEDVLGSVLPEWPCERQPGCGFLSRAAWFEHGLEQHLPRLRQGLMHEPGTPHLLLNSSWVETGERAIASDLKLEKNFPGAKDQLDILRHDLPLSTAAHNSARFPYTNAIGELLSTQEDCARRTPSKAAQGPARAASVNLVPCGHLADGGYYDNSGMATLVDTLRALKRCLDRDASMPACQNASVDLSRRLEIHVLMLRNEPQLSETPVEHCAGGNGLPTDSDVKPMAPQDCHAPAAAYQPGQPACAPASKLFVDELGPPITVLEGSGIGAHGRRDEALMAVAALEMPQLVRPLVAIDLLQHDVHFPLGWHLSNAAQDDARVQAGRCSLPR